MDAICLIGAPHAGIEQLGEVLGNFQDLAVCRGVFSHQAGAADESPGAVLDTLEESARELGKRLMCFSLFRGELTIEAIEREIMPRPGLRLVMVVRKQIDSFVHWRRAVELGRLSGIAGAAVRLKLDAASFAQWLDAEARWYEHWRSYLARRSLPSPILRYETDIDQPAERVLRRFSAAAGQVGITLRPPPVAQSPEAPPASETAPIADLVANWVEFNREIFARGLERRAFGYPI